MLICIKFFKDYNHFVSLPPWFFKLIEEACACLVAPSNMYGFGFHASVTSLDVDLVSVTISNEISLSCSNWGATACKVWCGYICTGRLKHLG